MDKNGLNGRLISMNLFELLDWNEMEAQSVVICPGVWVFQSALLTSCGTCTLWASSQGDFNSILASMQKSDRSWTPYTFHQTVAFGHVVQCGSVMSQASQDMVTLWDRLPEQARQSDRINQWQQDEWSPYVKSSSGFALQEEECHIKNWIWLLFPLFILLQRDLGYCL